MDLAENVLLMLSVNLARWHSLNGSAACRGRRESSNANPLASLVVRKPENAVLSHENKFIGWLKICWYCTFCSWNIKQAWQSIKNDLAVVSTGRPHLLKRKYVNRLNFVVEVVDVYGVSKCRKRWPSAPLECCFIIVYSRSFRKLWHASRTWLIRTRMNCAVMKTSRQVMVDYVFTKALSSVSEQKLLAALESTQYSHSRNENLLIVNSPACA